MVFSIVVPKLFTVLAPCLACACRVVEIAQALAWIIMHVAPILSLTGATTNWFASLLAGTGKIVYIVWQSISTVFLLMVLGACYSYLGFCHLLQNNFYIPQGKRNRRATTEVFQARCDVQIAVDQSPHTRARSLLRRFLRWPWWCARVLYKGCPCLRLAPFQASKCRCSFVSLTEDNTSISYPRTIECKLQATLDYGLTQLTTAWRKLLTGGRF